VPPLERSRSGAERALVARRRWHMIKQESDDQHELAASPVRYRTGQRTCLSSTFYKPMDWCTPNACRFFARIAERSLWLKRSVAGSSCCAARTGALMDAERFVAHFPLNPHPSPPCLPYLTSDVFAASLLSRRQVHRGCTNVNVQKTPQRTQARLS